ncbi:Pentatricopeptide repeat-containing protein [Vitis vinifera]|uniref:Pentatricopeptide repeat-containing protein n=1 Tax=Vitis vinifera TaxID=29760 RepID=A0A438GJV9_VITVI|nr:Pentatricopeptide repeat-containing protein [Vitis vinifera]
MERHVQTLLNKLSVVCITIATIIFLFLILQTPQTAYPPPPTRASASSASRNPPATPLAATTSHSPRKTSASGPPEIGRRRSIPMPNSSGVFEIKRLLSNHSKVLCVSAGAGHEVAAVSEVGARDVTGVELVESPPLCPPGRGFVSGEVRGGDGEDRSGSWVCVVVMEECGGDEMRGILRMFKHSVFNKRASPVTVNGFLVGASHTILVQKTGGLLPGRNVLGNTAIAGSLFIEALNQCLPWLNFELYRHAQWKEDLVALLTEPEFLVHKRHLNQIHAQLVVSGLVESGFLVTKFVNASWNIGEIGYARKVFDEFPEPSVFLWNAIIRGYSRHNLFGDAIEMYSRMQASGVSPDGFTLPCVLKACSGVPVLEVGKRVHGQIFRLGFESDVFVQNGLVALVWTERPANGSFENFRANETMECEPDWIALVSVLRAYTDVEDLEQGKSIHGCVVKLGLEFEPDLLISLTAMYAKCGQVMVARSFFDQMEIPNVMMWNAMISGYAKNGYVNEAVGLFQEMISKNIRTDSITVRSAILACAQVGSLELAKWMETTSIKLNLAREVFDRTLDKDVVVWSAMIVGYGLHGRGQDAIDLFYAMKQAGVCPNDVTFHYACVVDLLGRSGHLNEAYDFITTMPIEPGVSVWGALLGACKIYRHVTLGEYAAEQLFSLDPFNTGHYVQLSNLYASSRLWDSVAKVRILMREKGLSKDMGYSLIEINGKLQAFRVGDKSHPRFKEIFEELESLERRLKEAGFIPHIESVLHDLNQEEKEETLCNHSERLAIAYGLISTAPGTTLRITKNLRACINCHSATKLISKLVNREIVVRDANRFHHFKNGVCSCRDYW